MSHVFKSFHLPPRNCTLTRKKKPTIMGLNDLTFALDDALTLPPLQAAFIECTPTPDAQAESPFTCDSPMPFAASKLHFLPIISSRTLCEGDDVKTTAEIFIDIRQCDWEFLPGDTIGIWPENSVEEVDLILNRLNGVHDAAVISLAPVKGSKKKLPSYLPKLTTAQILLSHHLEIRGIVKKGLLRVLAKYTDASNERRRLEELCSREGAREYEEFFVEKGLCLLDILEAFDSCQPPLSVLLEYLPRLKPRVYSIASSPLANIDHIRIVFNVVTTSSQRKGVCSNWLFKQSGLDIVERLEKMGLKQSSDRSRIPVYFRQPTEFRIPTREDISMIMIGPGTGLSPFIGFLEHRQIQYSNSPISEDVKNVLLFGCRHKTRDDIYSDALVKFEREKLLNKLLICYSRDESSDSKYVQDLFYKEKQFICNLLMSDKTYLFVCGDAKNMAKDVHDVVVKSLAEIKDFSLEEAALVLKNLEKTGRYLKDVWR